MQTLPYARRFETFSYLPPLSDAQITKQLQYMLDQGYIPGVEFSQDSSPEQHYWTLWKLPLFNATNTNEILNEVRACAASTVIATFALLVSTTSNSAKF